MKKNGFTLIEILATITIVILLFMVMIPASRYFIEQSNKKQCEELKNVLIAGAELCVMEEVICNDLPQNKNETETVNLETLYNNGYIDEKYRNPVNNEELSKSNKFNDSKVVIKKIVDEATSGRETTYYTYDVVTNTGKNICE